VGTWAGDERGVLALPSGRRVRGRGLRSSDPRDPPEFAVYLLGRPPNPFPWPYVWVRWPDFRLPRDHDSAAAALRDLWSRAPGQRVEVACAGGRGRTGTALALLAVMDGVAPDEAVSFVRAGYDRRAVETPWQRRYVARARF
jgi:hypothetical protein